MSAALALAAWLGAAPSPDPSAVWVRIAPQLFATVSRAPLGEVVRRQSHAWEREGKVVTVVRTSPSEVAVGGFDTALGLQEVAALRDLGRGGTLILLASASLRPGAVDRPTPEPSSASGFAEALPFGIDAAERLVRERLSREGFRVESAEGQGAVRELLAVRGPTARRIVLVSLTPDETLRWESPGLSPAVAGGGAR